eukprot:656972-Rhodomonas_salina.1
MLPSAHLQTLRLAHTREGIASASSLPQILVPASPGLCQHSTFASERDRKTEGLGRDSEFRDSALERPEVKKIGAIGQEDKGCRSRG